MESAEHILKRMKRNKLLNTWWLKIFIRHQGQIWLTKKGLTPQAIGVWLNPYTSNQERLRIIQSAAI